MWDTGQQYVSSMMENASTDSKLESAPHEDTLLGCGAQDCDWSSLAPGGRPPKTRDESSDVLRDASVCETQILKFAMNGRDNQIEKKTQVCSNVSSRRGKQKRRRKVYRKRDSQEMKSEQEMKSKQEQKRKSKKAKAAAFLDGAQCPGH